MMDIVIMIYLYYSLLDHGKYYTYINQVHITREDTLRELKKLLGLKLDVFFYVFPGTCNVKSTFFFAHPTIFLCISVIFTGFFTSVSTSNFFYALTSVMPFDFIERSDRAVFMLALGDTIVGYCLDRVSRLAGLALVVEGMGVWIHQFSSPFNSDCPSSQAFLSKLN